MNIEEKRQAIKDYCGSVEFCSDCALNRKVMNGCWTDVSDKEIENNFNTIRDISPCLTRNTSKVSDTFICEKCGIRIEDYSRVEYDEDAEDTTHYEYEFKFCPECGRKIVEE